MEDAKKIWLDGALIDWAAASVHLISHSFHYGFNVFEGIRAYSTAAGPAVFRLDAHIDRLFNSAQILGMEIPFSRDDIAAACCAIVKANDFDRCYIRPIAYTGRGGMGLNAAACKVSVAVAAWFWGEYLGDGKLRQGIRIRTSSYARHHIGTGLSKAKTGANYTLFQIARAEALRDGYDEALLLDVNGHVAEGSVENIFLARGGVLVTPPLTHILEGITRDTIITLAHALGYEVREELFPRETVYLADEVFFCGTGAEVTPVVELDGRRIGTGRPGPITKRLQQLFFDVTAGLKPERRDWLTFVDASAPAGEPHAAKSPAV